MYTSTAYEIQKAKKNGSGTTYEKGQRLILNKDTQTKDKEWRHIVKNH